MTAYKLLQFISTLIFILPQLAVCVTGLIVGTRRRNLGPRARHGTLGFGLLVGAYVINIVGTYYAVYVMSPENFDSSSRISAAIGFASTGLTLGGFILLIRAAFHREQPKHHVASVT